MKMGKALGCEMRAASLGAIACAIGLITPLDSAEAGVRCRDTGSEARPSPSGPTLEIRTSNGPFRFRMAEWTRRCSRDGGTAWTETKVGLTDETGRHALVPARYDDVVPISDATAIVRVGHGGMPSQFFQYGVGETGVSPYYHAELMTDGAVTTPMAFDAHASESRTLYVFEGGAQPMTVAGVRRFEQMHGISENYIVDFTAESGEPVSRILDAAMRPVTPVIGRVEVWRTASANPTISSHSLALVSQTMRFEHPSLPYDVIYQPVNPDGTPLPLPAGALGVFPLRTVPNSAQSKEAHGWAVVFPTRDGFEIAPVLASLSEAMEQAAFAKRYTGMRRPEVGSAHGELMVRDAEGWRPTSPSLQPLHFMEAGAVFDDPNEGFIAVTQTWRSQAQLQNQNAEQRRAHLARELQAQADAQWARIQSGAVTLCGNSNPSFLPAEGLERFFRECDVDRTTERVFGARVTQAALATAIQRRDNLEQEQALESERDRQRRLFNSPDSAGDPWAQGLAAAQAAADESMNAVIQRENNVYQSNIAAWNSGAHNWRPAQ